MTEQSRTSSRYKLSFTSGALLMREAMVAARLYGREHDWPTVRAVVQSDNLLQTRTTTSSHRLAREVVQRLMMLNDTEIDILIDSTFTERSHLLWVAVCRNYAFIGEFAEEVLRERFLLLTPTLSFDNFDGFVRGKALWHQELGELTEGTLTKLRANLFRMLHEAELLSDNGQILQTVFSERVLHELAMQRPSDVRFFPAIENAPGGAAR